MSTVPAAFPIDPLDTPSEQYAIACALAGVFGKYAGAVDRYKALFRDGVTRSGALMESPIPPVLRVHDSDSGEGTVRKFLLPLGPAAAGIYDRADPGQTLTTESVIIPMIGKKRVLTHTLCVSSQVGCAMGCGFCQTAQMGLLRNLTAREIVVQWFAARHLVGGYQSDGAIGCDTIRNIVFMGMGEPMDNLDEVIKAIAVLTDHRGIGLPMSKVTISTVGRVDGLYRLAEQVRRPGWHRLNLAISLNAPNDHVRETIMPINRRYGMSELRTAIEAWPIYGAAKICIEYVLIPGVNDQPEHAIQLGDYVLGRGEYEGRPALPGLVNVIPYNPRENSPWDAPSEASVDRFLADLIASGVYAKRRRTKGRDTMAACGQLGNLDLKRRSREPAVVSVSIAGR